MQLDEEHRREEARHIQGSHAGDDDPGILHSPIPFQVRLSSSGATSSQPVVAQIIGEGQKNLVEVTIDTDGDRGDASESVTATDGHPFWAPALNGWLKATDLTAGQWLQTSAGTWVQVTEVKRWTQQKQVRNLTVSSEHTYYVLAGATAVLVRNCDLNLGSGDNPMEGATNLDIKPNAGVDVIASAESMPFRDGTFSTVHAINPFGFQAVSAETARVMQSGGMLMVTAARSNKWRKASADAIAEAGFELVSVGDLIPEHAFGIMKRADGGEIPAGAKFETRIYRKK
ncbi:polymorphic toxin-type HINT domain-containing protein [Streptomyces sp. NPDC090021]|uniref:polymorphic toxin-type HINT domain-containing protein n=1 Tax=Streptomyces sp. NPDC090021 TaxID=3365919 RepID=UPI003825ED3A